MRSPQTDASYRPFFIIVLLVLAGSAIASAACHTVTPAGLGTKSGADWNNSCAGFTGSCAPSSMVRGDTYFVGAGNYGSTQYVFNKADSGSLIITIQSPTTANNCTSTGWNASTMQGQAQFAPMEFTSDYWTINGSYRSTATGNPWQDWNNTSGYGIYVNNTNAVSGFLNQCSICFTQGHGNNIILEYVDAKGSGSMATSTPANPCDFGVWWQYGPFNNVYIGYSHFHDTGAAPNLLVDDVSNLTIEYNWIERDDYISNCHSEGIGLRSEGFTVNNQYIRYNFVENTPGTAPFIGTPGSVGGDKSNVWIYGNVVFYNEAEGTGQPYGGGDGVIDFCCENNPDMVYTDVYIYNNTFANLDINSQGQSISVGAGWPDSVNTMYIQNNLWYNSSTPASSPLSCTPTTGGSCTGVTQSPNLGPSADPFVNDSVKSAGADNYNLKAHTTAGVTLSSSNPPGCTPNVNCVNVDMSGTIRGSDGVWDQGAFQLAGGPTGPNPPTGLSAAVQ